MPRLRTAASVCVLVLALLAVAASAAAQTIEPSWQLVTVPSDGTTTNTNGTPDITKHLYVLRGEAGIYESPLPDSIKEDLFPPDTIPVGEEIGDDSWLVSQEIVAGIVASEAAGQLTPEIAAIAEPLDEETSSSSVTPNSIFGGSCATHDKTIARTVSLNGQDFTKTFPPDSGFAGNFSMQGSLQGSVAATLNFGLKRKNILGFCVPYGVKFKTLRAVGNATASAGLALSGNFSYYNSTGPSQIWNRELYSFTYRIGPIPIKLGINLVLSGGATVQATGTGNVNYNGTHVASGTFDYTCTLDNCTGTNTFDNSSTTGGQEVITGEASGRIKPVPYLDVALRALVISDSLIYAQVGVRPYFLGDLWGYLGNTCGDADGIGGPEVVRALTFDLDRRIDITGEAKFLVSPWKRTLRTGTVKHVSFWDLISSSALQPQLQGPGELNVDVSGTYKTRMRSCWPYTDAMTYQLNWGDGSAVQELSGAPATELSASHTWTAVGDKTVTATSFRDTHGRRLEQTYARTIKVKAWEPLDVTVTPSPRSVTQGGTVTWTATATGGDPTTTQFALFRRRAGTSPWIPDVTQASWQTSRTLSWTTTAADLGVWEIVVWVRDGRTPATMNTYGFADYANAGPVEVVAPLALQCTVSQKTATYGNPLTWSVTVTGGTPGTIQFALGRQFVATSVIAPLSWQTSNTFTWTPTSADVGAWNIYAAVKDVNTPANANPPYGYSTYCSLGTASVVAPLTLSITPSPATAVHGNAINWTATASGGTPSSTKFALFRRRAGATAWIPDVTAAAWQTSNQLSWTPAAADVGTWEIVAWVKDGNTPATMNTYGFAAYANAGPVQVVTPPLTLTVTPSPAQVVYGNPVSWTMTAGGGTPATTRYAFFRRRAGTTSWTPDVTIPNWQTGNVYVWIPTAADVGTWETYVWVKDGNTPATMNTYGYAVGANPGPVKVVTPPLTLTGTNSPAYATYGNAVTWTATASGGTPSTTKFALFRRRAGAAAWTPDVTAPAWQTSNVLSWTPSSADVGTWEIVVWVKDGDTPATMNTYGFAAYYNAQPVQVVAPLTVSGTGSPAYSTYGNTIGWTANANGGVPSTVKYALFRRRAGAASWIPDVTMPAWQTSNQLSWTPTSADVGTWEIVIWVKDGNTPATMNTYGFAAYYNAQPVQVVAPLTLSGTGSPSVVYSGTTISWSSNANGGVPSTRKYAFFRRRAGTTAWTPDVTAPAWTSSNNFSWTPTSADVGTWEIVFWVKDSLTPATMNTYGFAAYYNAGPVQVVSPLTVSGTGSPSSSPYGPTLTWTANANGGTGTSRRYAFFRRRAGTSAWTPDVTAPAWTSSNVMSWTPSSADVGTWEIIIWAKDSATPAGMNGYGFAAYYNAGPVQIVTPAPLTVSGTGSPSTSPVGTTISWTATTSGGVPSTVKYALFRRRAGTSYWIPDVTAPAWQTSRTLAWTPGAGDVGTWEIIIWVKDVNTTPTQNGYGFAAYYNAMPVQVY